MDYLKKTKVVATLGPAVTGKIFTMKDFNDVKNKLKITEAKEKLGQILDAGVNVLRFNFSHGTHEEQMIRIILARDVAKAKKINVSLMLDTKGPEIRVYKMKNGELEVKKGINLTIYTTRKIEGTLKGISVFDSTGTYNMAIDVNEGDTIFVDDGKLKLVAKKINVDKGEIITLVENNHKIKDNKRINLPNANYSIPFMSEKDMTDIKFAIDNKFDYIAASFVNNADNVREIKQILKANNCDSIQIISKIESMNAISCIESIIEESDAIMVARGDLGLEIPYYEVPYYEKYIIKSCRYHAKPVIVATQMLDSLETKMQATRAEVTDVFFAVERGTDSTMLSGETASGLYPVNAVSVMSTINKTSEKLFDYGRSINVYFKHSPFYGSKIGKIAKKTANIVSPMRDIENSNFEYSAVFYYGTDVNQIKALSNIRLAVPLFVVNDKADTANYFGIYYGVHSIVMETNQIQDYSKTTWDLIESLGLEKKKVLVIIDKKIIKLFP